MQIEGRKKAISRLVLASVLAVIIIAGSVFGLSLVNTPQRNPNRVPIEALSIDSSTSNITAKVNLIGNSSDLVRMGLFVNGTFAGAYNFTGGQKCCIRLMNSWSNGTYSYVFTATPYSMPMLGRMRYGGGYGCCMAGRAYMITIMANFANGAIYNATTFAFMNQQGMGSMMR